MNHYSAWRRRVSHEQTDTIDCSWFDSLYEKNKKTINTVVNREIAGRRLIDSGRLIKEKNKLERRKGIVVDKHQNG